MRKEYDVDNLNPRRNPYTHRLKKQITISIDNTTVDYFKRLSVDVGIPYQTLINMYLTDCAKANRKPNMLWK